MNNTKNVIVTGSQGFIGGYVVQELLSNGYKVIGIDDYSKYGKINRNHDTHKNFKLLIHDLSKSFPEIRNVDFLIAGAAMIGGISYFHRYAYDLLSTNERILSNTFDYAIKNKIKRILVLSSSMVYENCNIFPSTENSVLNSPPPLSSYGFQKLSSEYFAKSAYKQYGLEYTILRPFNCVGIGEDVSIKESKIMSGNIKLTLSHVIPDLILKCLKKQFPLHIIGDGNQVRCFTHGKDIARGIRMAMESNKAINNDFNLSTNVKHRILDVAYLIWNKINPNEDFVVVNDPPFEYDIKFRFPDVSKAKSILGFEAEIMLEDCIDEIITYIERSHEK